MALHARPLRDGGRPGRRLNRATQRPPPPGADADLTRVRRRARGAVAFTFFLHGAVAASWASRIPSVKSDLGLSEGALGIALVGAPLGALVVVPLSGAVTVRRGSRAATRVMTVATCAALVGPALAPNLALLFTTLLVLGACTGAMDIAMNAQGVALEGVYERPILAGFHGVWSLGGVAAGFTGGIAADAGISPALHLAAVAAVLAACGLAISNGLLHTEAERSPGSPAFTRPRGALAIMGGIAFAAMLAEGAALDWSGVYLRETLASSAGVAAGGVAAFSLGMAAGRFLSDGLSHRLGALRFVSATTVVGVAGMAVALVARAPATGVLGFAVLGAGIAGIVPVIFSRAGSMTRGSEGRGIASVATIGYAAFLVGPSLVGGMAELTSLRVALSLVAILLAGLPFLARRLDDAAQPG